MSFTAQDQQELFSQTSDGLDAPIETEPNNPIQEQEEDEFPALSTQEDNFALAVVECSGNVGKAYQMVFGKDDPNPTSRGTALITVPKIANRIAVLNESIRESSLISIGSHLMELAEIRDLGKVTGQLKVSLHAEVKRGEVAGFYSRPGPPPEAPSVNVSINMASPEDLMKYANKKMAIVEDVTPKTN